MYKFTSKRTSHAATKKWADDKNIPFIGEQIQMVNKHKNMIKFTSREGDTN